MRNNLKHVRPQTQRQGKKKKRGNRQKAGALKEISRDIKDLIRGVHSSSRRNDNSCFNSVIPSRRLNVRRQVYTYLNSGINAPFSSGSGTNRSLGYQRFQQPGPRFPSVSFTPSGPKRKWLIEFMLPIQHVSENQFFLVPAHAQGRICAAGPRRRHMCKLTPQNVAVHGLKLFKVLSALCGMGRERETLFFHLFWILQIYLHEFFFFFCLWQTGTGKELILEVTKAELNYRTSLQKKRKKNIIRCMRCFTEYFPS